MKNWRRIITTIGLIFMIQMLPMVVVAKEPQEGLVTVVDYDVTGILQEGGLLRESDSIIQVDNLNQTEQDPVVGVIDDATRVAIANALMTSWDAHQDECDLSSFNLLLDERAIVTRIIEKVLNDNPIYFNLAYGTSITYKGMGDKLTSVVNEYHWTQSEYIDKKTEYDAVVQSVKDQVDSGWSDVEKALFIHDWLVDYCSYDTTLALPHCHDAYGALVEKKPVCQGYALAYMELARKVGLQCTMVTSNSLEHAWNLVRIGTNYYQMDATWDDPIGVYDWRVYHNWFLKSTDIFITQDGGKHFDADDWVYGQNWSAEDTSLNDAFWNEVIRQFLPIGGKWYYINQATGKVATAIYSGGVWTLQDLETTTQTWPDLSAPGAHWGYWNALQKVGDYIYYSTPDKIFALKISDKSQQEYYILPSDQKAVGCIYGLQVEDGILKYFLSEGPNPSQQVLGTVYSTQEMVTVSFDANGGTVTPTSKLVAKTGYFGTLPIPINSGYSFDGWFTLAVGGEEITASSVCSGEITLYAHWTENACTHDGAKETRGAQTENCTVAGYTGDTYCLLCNTKIANGSVIPATGHTTVTDGAVAATCTTAGKTEGKHCSVCSAVIIAQTTIPAKGHTTVTDNAIAATCTTAGKTEGKHCSVCNTVITAQTTIPAKGHTTVTDNAIAATCTTAGKTEGKHCSVCNTVITAQTTIPAKGHTVVIDKGTAAACTTAGKTEGKHCSVCNTVITAQTNIPAKGHTEVTDRGTAATCTQPGKTDGKHCSVCNTVLTSQREIAALGHSYDDGKVIKEPTLIEEGEKLLTCTRCQVTRTETIPKVEPKNAEEKADQQIQGFSSRMYTVALGRKYDQNGLMDWSNKLKNHEIDGAGIAQGFFMSKEFINKNHSDNDFVDILYRTFFDREADAGGKKYWMDKLASGTTRQFVLAGFVNSKEFTKLCGDFGIVRGTFAGGAEKGDATESFVLRLYSKVLGRNGDANGVKDWVSKIKNKVQTPETVAKGFFGSKEFIKKGLSNEEYVEVLYQTFMDRSPDKAGKADWVAKLNAGADRTAVLEGFSRSKEFKKIMESFGL